MSQAMSPARKFTVPARSPNAATAPGHTEARLHIKAGIALAVMLLAVRIAIELQVTWVVLVPLFLLMIWMTCVSPPISALSLLYGWVLYGSVASTGVGFLPRIPVISVLTVWTILCLLYWRNRGRTLKQIARPVVVWYLFLLAAFLSVGFVGALISGHLANNFVLGYNWDIFRGWLGYLVIALLGCRNLDDLRILLIGLPIAFLAYPLSLPLQVWQDFFGRSLFSVNLLSIGLAYGSLNTDTLGQAAAAASVVAASAALTTRSRVTRRWMAILFLVSGAIILMTSSRQALLGWLIGLAVIGVALGLRRGVLWLAVLAVAAYIGAQALIAALPEGSGLQARVLELAQPPDTWASESFTIRRQEFEQAVTAWSGAPIFGLGFGGQRFDEVETAGSFSDVSNGALSFSLGGTHNLPLGILAQTGVVGMLLFLLFGLGMLNAFITLLRRLDGLDHDNAKLARVAIPSVLVSIFAMQNISGGIGVSSSAMIFLFGAMLGVLSSYPKTLGNSNLPARLKTTVPAATPK
jgi:O-antigen ligase